MLRSFRIWIARRRLERLVAERMASFETQDFAKRRKAGKLGWKRRGLA